jgi:Cyclic nucleotide-binding domain/Tetratricopeptide repeat
MVLGWLASKDSKPMSVPELIARKQYAKAVEILQGQLAARPKDSRIRLQLADTLILAGRGPEAVRILRAIADELAQEGFAAKSIAILKRIQKIEPASGVEDRLASMIEQKNRLSETAMLRMRVPAPTLEFGMEEAGEELPEMSIGSPAPRWEPPPDPDTPEPAPAETEAAPVDEPVAGAEAELDMDAAREAVPELRPVAAELPAPKEDFDFAEQDSSGEADDEDSADARPMLATPLFPDFTKEELLALMGGLKLIVFDPGEIIVAEGAAGDSLFLLTTGAVKAWVKNPDGHYSMVRELAEGDFFGEISILTGKPRTATVTAADRCELLELDKRTLDLITAYHPRVLTVLQSFYDQRNNSADETRIRSGLDGA